MDFMDHGNGELDLPLKAALKRVLGRETAPRSLQARVAIAIGSVVVRPAPLKNRFRIRQILTQPITPRIGAAVAAAILLVATGLWWTIGRIQQRRIEPMYSARYSAPQPLPESLAQAMLMAHQAAARSGPDSGQLVAGASIEALRTALEQGLGGTPWLADLRPEGWTFVGARLTKIDQSQAAQVLYRKGSTTLSVVSMPLPPSCATVGFAEYQNQLEGGPVLAGFSAQGWLYCLVGAAGPGDPALTVAEIIRLKARCQGEIMPSGCGTGSGH